MHVFSKWIFVTAQINRIIQFQKDRVGLLELVHFGKQVDFNKVIALFISVHCRIRFYSPSGEQPLVSSTTSNIAVRYRENQDYGFSIRNSALHPNRRKQLVLQHPSLRINKMLTCGIQSTQNILSSPFIHFLSLWNLYRLN